MRTGEQLANRISSRRCLRRQDSRRAAAATVAGLAKGGARRSRARSDRSSVAARRRGRTRSACARAGRWPRRRYVGTGLHRLVETARSLSLHAELRSPLLWVYRLVVRSPPEEPRGGVLPGPSTNAGSRYVPQVVTNAVREALDPRHYPGRGGGIVRFFVALIFLKIAMAIVFAFGLLLLYATGNL